MPQVPRVQRTIDYAPIPGVRKQAAETPLSEGAGLAEAQARTGEEIARTGGQMFGVAHGWIQKERDRADEVALLNAENTLAKWENQRLYDPQQGALSVKGKDSFGLPEMVGGEYDSVANSVESGLNTDRQRAAFARIRASRGISLDLTLRRHVYGEMQAYEGHELQAFLENGQSAAIQNASDPRRVGMELGAMVDAIKQHAPRLGLGPEQVQHQVEAVTSATHVGVIEQLLAEEKNKAAQVYFDEARSQIKGDAIARVEKALAEGGLRSQSQKLADQILADPALDSISKQEDKAKELAGDNADLRDHLNQRLEHANAVKEKADRDQDEATLKNLFTIVDTTHDVTKIPAAQWQQLTGGQRAQLMEYSDRLTRGVAVETDQPTFYAMMLQAADTPETFAKQNLLNYRAKLSDGDFKSMVGLQASIRKGDRESADKQLSGFRTTDQIVKDGLTDYGLDPTPKEGSADAKAKAALQGMLDLRVQQQEALTGKKPINEEIRGYLDEILSTSKDVKGSWWNAFKPGAFFDRSTRVTDLTVRDVPATERALIEQQLRENRMPISDATVLAAYRWRIMRDARAAK